jgi:large subunit ribosomal protein L15
MPDKILKKKTTLKVTARVGITREKKAPVPSAKNKDFLPKAPVAGTIGLFNLKAPAGSHKKRKYLGRGPSSGHGKTSTRGSKGQTSRAGRHFYLGFEGGQSPLIRKMPKRGFRSIFKKEYQIINLRDLNRINQRDISLSLLEEKGLIKDKTKLVKVLGEGRLKDPLNVQAHGFSKRAASEIRKLGGKVEVIDV